LSFGTIYLRYVDEKRFSESTPPFGIYRCNIGVISASRKIEIFHVNVLDCTRSVNKVMRLPAYRTIW